MFFSKIYKSFDIAFPLVKTTSPCSSKKPSVPWLTPALLSACRKKSRLLKKYSKNKSPENKTLLTTFRNKLKACLRQSERNYYKSKFLSTRNNCKATWKLLNKLINNNYNQRNNFASTPKMFNDNKITSSLDIADQFNSFFFYNWAAAG